MHFFSGRNLPEESFIQKWFSYS